MRVALVLLILLVLPLASAASVTHTVNGDAVTFSMTGTPPFLINIRGDAAVGQAGGYAWARTSLAQITIDLSFAGMKGPFYYGVSDGTWSSTQNFELGGTPPLQTCSALGGQGCILPDECQGVAVPSLDVAECCLGICAHGQGQPTCAEMGGFICTPTQVCSGTIGSASDTAACCFGSCVPAQLTCAEMGGHICTPTQVCSGTIGSASDTAACCLGSCDVPPGPTESLVAAPWTIKLSSTGQTVTLYFGEYGDTPVPGDYDGDGVTDLAVWRRYRLAEFRGPSSTWIIHLSTTDTIEERSFGDSSSMNSDVPVQADYDGDGITDLAYFRQSDNVWTIKKSSNGQTETRTWDPWPPGQPYAGVDDDFLYAWNNEWTLHSAVPMADDYDGDGLADLIAFRPYNEEWKIQQSSNGQTVTQTFGKPGVNTNNQWEIFDIGIPADYDGDGVVELAIRRPDERRTTVQNGANVIFGEKNALPVTGDFDGDGRADSVVFQKTPPVSFTYSGELTTHDNYNGRITKYNYNPSVFRDDDGTYRFFWCGNYDGSSSLDVIWQDTSTSSTGQLTHSSVADRGGCNNGALKVPASINPTFSAACGASNDVYLLYYEDGSTGHGRNKVALKYNCDPDTQAWTSTSSWIIDLGTVDYGAYGAGHPRALYLEGKVYLLYYYHVSNTPGSERSFHLAVSTDGETFSEQGRTGYSERVSYLEDLNLFVGTSTYDSSERIYFTKDIGDADHWIPVNQYARINPRIPHTKECSLGGAIMVGNSAGIIEGDSTYMHAGQWDRRDPAVDCYPFDSSILDSELYAVKVDFDFTESKCIGAKYRKVGGSVQKRVCTATGWGAWSTV